MPQLQQGLSKKNQACTLYMYLFENFYFHSVINAGFSFFMFSLRLRPISKNITLPIAFSVKF